MWPNTDDEYDDLHKFLNNDDEDYVNIDDDANSLAPKAIVLGIIRIIGRKTNRDLEYLRTQVRCLRAIAEQGQPKAQEHAKAILAEMPDWWWMVE